jgi:very-short-patch-repair endonuclease
LSERPGTGRNTVSSRKSKPTYAQFLRSAHRQKYELAFERLCQWWGIPDPVRNFRFHPVRLWKADFAWPAQKLIVEIEGGIWRRGGGAHSHPLGIERDIEKYNAATMLGYRILRVTDKMLAQKRLGELSDLLKEALSLV